MKIKKFFYLACWLSLCLACVACNMRSTVSNQGDTDSSEHASEGVLDNNNVENSESDTTEKNFDLISQTNGRFTYKCADCNEEVTFTVTCVSGTQDAYTFEKNTLTFANVTEDSAYDIEGTLHGNIVIDVSENLKFELQMSGFELNSSSACPITILSGDKVTLSAKKSTSNYICDKREAVDATDETSISASIYALCDLNIQGKGSLNISSDNNNGIHTKDDLKVKNLSLQVDCKDNALKGNDSVTIESGSIVLIARQGDGIKTTGSDLSSNGKQRGTVTISGGDIVIYAACDGIDAAYDAVINEDTATVTLQIFTDKYSEYSEEVAAVSDNIYYVRYNSTNYKYSLKFYNDDIDAVWYSSSSYTTVGNYRYYPVTKPSGYSYFQLYIYSNTQTQGQDEDYIACTECMAVNNNFDTIALQSRNGGLTYSWTNYTTSQNNFGFGGMGGFGGPGGFGGMNGGNTDKGDYSTKGIKADNAIIISAGTITINSYDDAIHANNDVVLESGASPSGNVTVSGGNLILSSNDDGIHADGKVTIIGGTVDVVNSYEGIEGNNVEISGGNISVISSDDGINGTVKSGTAITVSGGNLYVYAGGDGVDSNSTSRYSGIIFSGGESVIISTGQADSSIDTENGYTYSGGYVIGICKSGGMGSESTNCSNFSSVGTSKTISLKKDAYLKVGDVATVKIPVSINALVVFLGGKGSNISSSTTTDYTLDANGVYWNE